MIHLYQAAGVAPGAADWRRIDNIKNNEAAGAPTVGDDNTLGYETFSRWKTGADIYELVDPTTGAAVWVLVGAGGGSVAAADVTYDNSVSLLTATNVQAAIDELVVTVGAITPGSGDVTAAAPFGVDNVLIRSDGTGKGVQASGIVIDDTDNVTGVQGLAVVNVLSAAELQTEALGLEDSSSAFRCYFLVTASPAQTADRNVTWNFGNAARAINILGDLTVTGTTSVSGANTGDQTNITGNAATVTTNHNMTGPITGTGNVTSITSQTGTGTTFVMSVAPTLTGVPLAPTAAPGTNTTQLATTAFVTAAVAAGGGGTVTSVTGTAPIASSGGATPAISLNDDGVTNAKLANMATKTYKGRTTAGTGDPEDVAVATLKTDLVLVKGDVGLGNVDNTSDIAKPVSTAQQAAIDAAVVGLMDYKGVIDCSANPNYPAALKADFYKASVAGKIGGAAGIVVSVGDMIIASADNAGGDQATVGTSWFVEEGNIPGITTAGNSFITLANPSAITFPRINADNSVTALSAAAFLSAIGGGTGNGTVTAVSIATANGVSGSSSGGATPALTIVLGAIVPTTVNGITITTGTGTLTLSTFTLTVTGTASVSGTHTGTSSGTNTGDQTNISGNAATVTTNANLTGPIASVGNATTVSADLYLAARSFGKRDGLLPFGIPPASWTSASGTVTTVSIVTANGVSGSVANATTTPAITITLGAITPTTVNGNTLTTGTGTLTLSTFTLTVAGTASVSGTNTGDQTNISGNAATVTTNANMTGDVTSVGNATTIAPAKVTGAMLTADAIIMGQVFGF